MPQERKFLSVKRSWLFRYLAPVLGMGFFLIGAAFLLTISVGRWRIRSWPGFSEESQEQVSLLERRGNIVYWHPDSAIFIGLGLIFMGLFFFVLMHH